MATVTYQFAKNQPVFYMKDNRIHENTIKEVSIDVSEGETISYTLQNDAVFNEDSLFDSAGGLCDYLADNIVDDND